MTRSKLVALAAAALLALYWWMATSVSDTMGAAGDEIAHLTAGYSYWSANDYRLQPENGNLPQRWGAIPLLWSKTRFPSQDQMAWRISDVWDIGQQWFYENGNDLAGMLRSGRRMIALFGIGMGALVFYWARKLNGEKAALLAVGLFAFCPTMLANGGVITSDITAGCMFLAAVTAYWAMIHRLTALRVLVFGLTLGLLSVAKFSSPLIVPMAMILFAVRLAGAAQLESSWPFGAQIRGRLKVALCILGATFAASVLAVAVIWAFYGFRYGMYNHYEANRVRPLVGWDVLEDQGGPEVAAVEFARAHKLLPESYIYGFAHTYRFSRYRKSFLNGEYRSLGWVSFFPYTTAVKTPIALFGLIAIGLLHEASQRRMRRDGWERLYSWAPLLALFSVYWAFSLKSGLNIGHRHILPVYPVYFVAASAAACWLTRSLRWTGITVAALALWFAGESIWIRPHYLAYFNEIVGPKNAWKHLVDSSLDWGQDLPTLKSWLDAHPPGGPVMMSYFGPCEPSFYGIQATRVADRYMDPRPRPAPVVFRGGLWIISVTQFQQVYTDARGPWDAQKERHYQEFLARLISFESTHKKFTYLEAQEFEEYQFARLCHVLRDREPLAQPGYTFLVFKLTDEDVNLALYGPVRIP